MVIVSVGWVVQRMDRSKNCVCAYVCARVCMHTRTHAWAQSQRTATSKCRFPEFFAAWGGAVKKELKPVTPMLTRRDLWLQQERCRLDSWRDIGRPGKVSLEENYSWQRRSCLEWGLHSVRGGKALGGCVSTKDASCLSFRLRGLSVRVQRIYQHISEFGSGVFRGGSL